MDTQELAMKDFGRHLAEECVGKYKTRKAFCAAFLARNGFVYSVSTLNNHLSGKYTPTIKYRVGLLRLFPNDIILKFHMLLVPATNLSGGGQDEWNPEQAMDTIKEYEEHLQHATVTINASPRCEGDILNN